MNTEKHLLIVDDDDRLRSLLKRFLSGEGYRVSTAESAKVARRLLGTFDFDLAILDIMMPEEGGLSLLASIREWRHLPVILLTARDLASDRINGLKCGADDYVTKPFEPEELSLRIASILRRASHKADMSEPVRLSGLVFDPIKGVLQSGEKSIHLTESERQLLIIMAKHAGETVARNLLALKASNGVERAIDVHVTRLRKKIEPDPKEPIHLQTVRGVGYRLVTD
jgi:two-component system phosphate regulon response regulator OmpR